MAENEPTTEAVGAQDEDRGQAIAEILAELKNEPVTQEPVLPPPSAEEPEPPPEAPSEEAEETPQATDEPSPAPKETEAVAPLPTADRGLPTPSPRPSAHRALLVLQALALVAFVVGTWVVYRRVASTLAVLTPKAEPQGTTGRLAASPSAAASDDEPLPEPENGLRYTQEMEKSGVLFEKGEYHAAAAGYHRALAAMPRNWNDGSAAFRLGECYFRLGSYPRAVAAYERVAQAPRGKHLFRSLYQIGEAQMQLKSYARAREAFYALLLIQGSCGPEMAKLIEDAYYRVADGYWLEAQAIAQSRKGSDE